MSPGEFTASPPWGSHPKRTCRACSASGAYQRRNGLISRTRRATARLSRLEDEPLRDVTTWLARYQRFWDENYERLDELLAALREGEEHA